MVNILGIGSLVALVIVIALLMSGQLNTAKTLIQPGKSGDQAREKLLSPVASAEDLSKRTTHDNMVKMLEYQLAGGATSGKEIQRNFRQEFNQNVRLTNQPGDYYFLDLTPQATILCVQLSDQQLCFGAKRNGRGKAARTSIESKNAYQAVKRKLGV